MTDVRFTIIGSGAIGGTVGAYLARAGAGVRFVDASYEHVEAMQRRGLTIEAPSETFTLPVLALHPEELTAPLHMVLLAVKAQDTVTAMARIAPLLGPGEAVVSLQNGLCERTIRDWVGDARTVGAFVNFSADLIGPGRIRYFGPGDFYLGELNGSISSRVCALTDALRAWGDVNPTDNIWGYLWSKLAYANMLFATALADADQANVVERFRKLMAALAVEVCEVADRERVRLMPFHGFDPDLYRGHGWEEVDESLDGLISYMRVHQKPRSGIWRDLAVRRRKTEVDHQIGLAVEIGHRYDLELPRTRRLVRMIHEIEDGTRAMTWSNLEELATP